MNLTKYISYALIAVLTVTLFSCNLDKFEEYNTDPYSVTPEHQKGDWLYLGGYITQMEKSIYSNANNWDWDFQIAQNLGADIFS